MKPTFYPKNIFMQIKLQIIFIFFFFHCIFVQVFAQKFDNSWVFGNYNATNNYIYSFDNDTLSFKKSFPKILPMDYSNCSISDSLGNLQFFTNGVSIANRNGKYMDGGKYINPKMSSTPWFDYGAPTPQQTLIFPCKNNHYLIFHADETNPLINNSNYRISPSLYTTLIDMSINSGDGKVIKLNNLILKDTLNSGQLTTCKHANGRDWWVLAQKFNSNLYYIMLVSNDSVVSITSQNIGENIFYPAAQACFSPDDSKYIRSMIYEIKKPSYIEIFDFDRCTGKLSNEKLIKNEDSTSVWVCGGAISPNSRFLYVTYQWYIFQYDLWANDIAASKDTVAIYDEFKTPLGSWTTFWLAQLGPDGKIYIMTGPNATNYLHIIDQPDNKGKACNVKQHAFEMGANTGWSIPNFPNYRLGPLKGSPCDTLSVANKDITLDDFEIKLFPNPASTDIKIDITLKEYDPAIKTEVIIVDVSGAIVQKYTMPDFAYLATIDISKLASGVYGVQLRQPKRFGERVLAVEKLVVIR